MDLSLVRALVSQRVPAKCPMCDKIEGIEWTEFKVYAADAFYVVDGILKERIVDEKINVFCTRCDEEIRPEDVK